jgi:hypothetical protein
MPDEITIDRMMTLRKLNPTYTGTGCSVTIFQIIDIIVVRYCLRFFHELICDSAQRLHFSLRDHVRHHKGSDPLVLFNLLRAKHVVGLSV